MLPKFRATGSMIVSHLLSPRKNIGSQIHPDTWLNLFTDPGSTAKCLSDTRGRELFGAANPYSVPATT